MTTPAHTPTFGEPLEMLAACHHEIEAQLCALEELAGHIAAKGTDDACRRTAAHVMRYFDTAGTAHHRDEEEDVFPLLRRLAAEHHRPEVSAVINDLEGDHASLEAQWARLHERLGAIAAGSEVRLDAEDVAHFAWLYRRHMGMEAGLVLPFARETIGEIQRAALGSRMAARRTA
jgi:hemerythrin-like domain-containing protein